MRYLAPTYHFIRGSIQVRASSAQPLKIMRIMHICLYAPGFPTESGMTHCAKHLVTTLQFMNAGSTRRTRFRIVRNKRGGRYAVGVTCVSTITSQSFDFVTIGACPFFAYTAFPLTT